MRKKVPITFALVPGLFLRTMVVPSAIFMFSFNFFSTTLPHRKVMRAVFFKDFYSLFYSRQFLKLLSTDEHEIGNNRIYV